MTPSSNTLTAAMKYLLDWAPVAAWLGLGLSLYTWYHSIRIKIKVVPLLSINAENGMRLMYSERNLHEIEPQNVAVMKKCSIPALRIVNESLKPVYIDLCSFGPTPRFWWKASPVRYLDFSKGVREGKVIDENGTLETPFPLQPQEAITVRLMDLHERWRVHNLIEWGFFYVCVQTADERSFGASFKKLLEYIDVYEPPNAEETNEPPASQA